VPQTTSAATGNGLRREVFGYALANSLGDPTVGYPSWNFDLLSTVAFFSIRVTYNGQLVGDGNWTVWDSSTLTGLVNTAHAHGVKVVVSLTTLYHDSVDFCDTLYNDKTTVSQIVNQVQLKGVDGVNIDYEGQLGQCQNVNDPTLNTTNQALLTKFAADLRAGLDAVKPGYYLSVATYSGSASGTDGFFNIPDLNKYVDAFFVMAYDMDEANSPYAPLNCSSFCLSPISPMANYYWNDTTSANQYSAVVGPGKVILGQPYYGRVACVSTPANNAASTGYLATPTYLDAAGVVSSPDVQPGTYATHRDGLDPLGQDRWDSWYDTSLGCWREMYWEDTTTLGVRYDLVNQDNLRGVGLWTLNYGGGASELWSALSTYFKSCYAVSVSFTPGSPTHSGTGVAIAASASCPDPNPVYEFWIAAPGATSWRLAQAYSTASTFNWDTTSAVGGTYGVSVWARDSNSAGATGDNGGRWDTRWSGSYTLLPNPCSSTVYAASPASPAIAGTPVTITASSSGCPSPLYQFWMAAPGGSWQVVQAYSTSPTFNWSTTGAAAGTYSLSVWVRDASSIGTTADSGGRYDARNSGVYTLTSTPCSAASYAISPASPAKAGTPVTITASASGCPNPLYQFWTAAPGGSWQIVQAYSTSSTFNWSTTGAAAGTYSLSVWVRDASSIGTTADGGGRYDARSSGFYALTSTPCSAASYAVSPASPAKVGTAVTITASASGCANPLYQFWMAAPGGSWQIVQAYSTSSTFNWSTTGAVAGTYSLSVWVRDASSIGTTADGGGRYDARSSGFYTLS